MMLTFYTDRFVPDGAAACARGPFIFIRPKYKGDAGLLAHEQTHVRQFWRLPIIYSFAYLVSRRFRFDSEVEAYREQAKHYQDDRLPLFAEFIGSRYKLRVTQKEALEALRA